MIIEETSEKSINTGRGIELIPCNTNRSEGSKFLPISEMTLKSINKPLANTVTARY